MEPLSSYNSDGPVSAVTNKQVVFAAVFAIVHIPLAVAMRASSTISTVHALATLAIGLVLAFATRRMSTLAFVVMYIAGSEVLWRMTKASVFWEFGKYSVVAILVFGLTRLRLRQNRLLPIFYFVLLLPSIILTLEGMELEPAREEISFYLSGPLTVAVAVLFFSNVRLSTSRVHSAFWCFVAPVVGIATLTFVSTRSGVDLEFSNNSSFVTSGSFGPNQVAAVLGLASMFVVLILLQRPLPWKLRFAMIALATIGAGQAALTFSRGGIGLAFLGICGAIFSLFRQSRRSRMIVLLIAGIGFLLGNYVVTPELDSFTAGKFGERYASTRSSGRDQFVDSELTMFREKPILGVGPGMGAKIRAERDLLKGPSHTEYTRMLAEHGFFGLIAIGCLLALAVRALRRAIDPVKKANAVALVLWFAAAIGIYGTRIVAPAVVFGLAFAMTSTSRLVKKTGRARAGFRREASTVAL